MARKVYQWPFPEWYVMVPAPWSQSLTPAWWDGSARRILTIAGPVAFHVPITILTTKKTPRMPGTTVINWIRSFGYTSAVIGTKS